MATKKRTDPAWKYGEEVLPDGGEQKKGYVYIKCKFCLRTITGGVLRMKNHLAGTHANTTPCESAPKEVVKEMKEYLERGKKLKKYDKRILTTYLHVVLIMGVSKKSLQGNQQFPIEV